MDDRAGLANEVLLRTNGFAAATANAKLTPQLAVAKERDLVLGAGEQRPGRRTASATRTRA
jgi:hypothetical protein